MAKKSYLFFFCLFLFVSCEKNIPEGTLEKEQGFPVKIVDIVGEVVVNSPPEKIVIAGTPLYAEILIDLNASEKIVGIAQSKNIPKKLQEIASVGKPLQPNMEQIISLEPDIVLGVTSSFRSKLEQMSIPVFVAGTAPYGIINSLKELYTTINKLDRILHGNIDKSKKIIADTKEYIKNIENQIKDENTIKVAILYVSPQASPYVIGNNSIENELLLKAKGKNVFEKSGITNMEVLFQEDPDIIITDPSQVEIIHKEDVWKNMQAVKNNKVFGIKASSWTSSHVSKTFEKIVKILHPNIVLRSKK